MSETYVRGGYERATAGGVLLMVVSFLSAVLVLAGLYYAAGTSERHKAALAAAGCEPNLSPSGMQCITASMLASQYMALATPLIRQLKTDAAAYTGSERHDLVAAEVALMSEVTSEDAFGASMARFPFPPAVAPIAEALIQANRARAQMTAEQARSSSLTQMRSFNDRVRAASAAAQTEVKLVREALNSPPTANQEP